MFNERVLNLNDKRLFPGRYLVKENPNPRVSHGIDRRHQENEEIIGYVADEMIRSFPGRQ